LNGDADVKENKLRLLFFITGFICLFFVCLYMKLIYGFPKINSETPQQFYENKPEPEVNKLKNAGGNYIHTEAEIKDTSSEKYCSANIYVREIPLPLEPEIDERLARFREKAEKLNQQFPDHFVISLNTAEKTVALTFDDGPDSDSTLEIVNILNKYKVPGTFFLLGTQIDKHPHIVNTILESGHSIGNHSWSHKRPTDINTEAVMDEVVKTGQRLAGYGVDTKLYRPPYGLVNPSQMPALIEAGYRVICWSIDSMDWYFDNPNQIAACVIDSIHPGAIVLMHSAGGKNNRKATIEALPVIIERLLDKGYRFTILDQN